jgi:hypothetical protein
MKDLERICNTCTSGIKWFCEMTRISYFTGVRIFGSPRKALYATITALIPTLIIFVFMAWFLGCCRTRKTKTGVVACSSKNADLEVEQW